MYNSVNDAALAHLSALETKYNVEPKYSDEVASTLHNIADIYAMHLTSEEKAALTDTSGHYNAISDELYHLLEIAEHFLGKVAHLDVDVDAVTNAADATIKANTALITTVTFVDGEVEIDVDPSDLSASADGKKYVALEVETGMSSIKDVMLDGTYFTDDDVTAATANGLSAGSFYLPVDVGALGEADQVIHLSAVGYPTVEIKIALKD